MIFKTKLLVSIVGLGVFGGTGVGVYYLKNKNNSEITKENSESAAPVKGTPASNPTALTRSDSQEENTRRVDSPGTIATALQPPQLSKK